MLEEFAQITHENYPDIPDYDEFAKRISERQTVEKVKSKKHNAKRNSRHCYSKRKYYQYLTLFIKSTILKNVNTLMKDMIIK